MNRTVPELDDLILLSLQRQEYSPPKWEKKFVTVPILIQYTCFILFSNQLNDFNSLKITRLNFYHSQEVLRQQTIKILLLSLDAEPLLPPQTWVALSSLILTLNVSRTQELFLMVLSFKVFQVRVILSLSLSLIQSVSKTLISSSFFFSYLHNFKIAIYAFVASHPDYCNFVFAGLSASSLCFLHLVQNYTPHLLFCCSKFTCTPIILCDFPQLF